MLFRKKMPKSCAYCVHGTKLSEEQVLCMKKGIVSIEGKCGKFRYDPLKRIPFRQPKLQKYKAEDFIL